MDQLIVLSLVILGLPLLSFILIVLNQRTLSENAHIIATPIMSFSVALSLYVAWMKLKGSPAAILEWSTQWFGVGAIPGVDQPVTNNLVVSNGVMLDNLTAIMLVVVTVVSFLVHLFSSEYMKNDIRYARYFAYLGLFTFAMLGIVLVNNLFGLFMCWELVGFASYALIGHWHERPAPAYAARKAFLTNRVGDVFMLIGIMILYAEFHSFNYREIFGFINQGLPITFSFLGLSPETTLTVAGIFLFVGAMGKSAQFPLHVWLPDAMEGPTPVSALIHAATMVTAGVYFTARIFPLLTGDAMLVLACVGAFTAALAATVAFTQNDIKRVLAYSTISQLGLMTMAIGAGAVSAGLFHLVTHAAFKACLFLCAGSVIHAMHHAQHSTHDHTNDAQDMRNMGGLLKKMPITGWTFIVATLAITGIPLFSGFLSKEEILAGTSAYGSLQGGIAVALPYIGFAVTLLTAFYMWRQVIMVFFGTPRVPELYEHIRESPKLMTVPLIVLAVLSLSIWYGKNPIDAQSGWFLKKWVKTPAQVAPPQTAPRYHSEPRAMTPQELTEENESFGYSVSPIAQNVQLDYQPMPHQLALERESRKQSQMAMFISLGSALMGVLLAWFLYFQKYGRASRVASAVGPVYRFSLNRWYIDELYEYMFVDTFLFISRGAAWFDENIIDGFVNAIPRITVFLARIIGWFDHYIVDGFVSLLGGIAQFFGLIVRSFQTGRVQNYMAWTLAGVVVLFFVVRYMVM